MVRKFVDLRSQSPTGQETFSSATSRRDIYTLHARQHRGLTWFDAEYGVAWLLGFGIHREGHRSDAYRVLATLDRKGRLLPDADDYEELFRERDARRVPEMVLQIRSLLARARAEPEQAHSALIGEGVRVTLHVERVSDASGTIEELHLAVSARYLENGWLDVIRTTLLPSYPTEQWQFTSDFPDRGPSGTELRFRHWHEMESGRSGGER